MVKFYLRKVLAEEMILEEVPSLWIAKVKKELAKLEGDAE